MAEQRSMRKRAATPGVDVKVMCKASSEILAFVVIIGHRRLLVVGDSRRELDDVAESRLALDCPKCAVAHHVYVNALRAHVAAGLPRTVRV